MFCRKFDDLKILFVAIHLLLTRKMQKTYFLIPIFQKTTFLFPIFSFIRISAIENVYFDRINTISSCQIVIFLKIIFIEIHTLLFVLFSKKILQL